MIFNQDYTFENNQVMYFALNRFECYIKYSDKCWKLSYRYLNESKKPIAETVPVFEKYMLETWVFEKPCNTIKFMPRLPDKPVLAEFFNPTYVLPGQSIELFEIVPLMIDIILEGNIQMSLKKIPIYPFSLTWLGNLSDGELCYHDEAETIFSKDSINYENGTIICPIHIYNSSEESFSLKQLSIRTEFLSIFCKNNIFWSDKMKIDYQGENKDAPLEILNSYGKQQGYELICPAREDIQLSNGILKRLSNLKSLMM